MNQPDIRGGAGRALGGCLLGLSLLGLTACGDGTVLGAAAAATALTGPSADTSPRPQTLRDVPEVVDVQKAALRSTPGGCEVDVTYRNTSHETAAIGFTYRAFDAHGREVASLSTPVQSTGPGEAKTISSGGTTAGSSGVPCAQIARIELKGVTALIGT